MSGINYKRVELEDEVGQIVISRSDIDDILQKLQTLINNTDELELKADTVNLNTDEVESKLDTIIQLLNQLNGLISSHYTIFKGDVVSVGATTQTIDLQDTYNYVSLANTGNKDIYISFDNINFFRIITGGVRDLDNVAINKIYVYGEGNSELDYMVAK